MMIPVVPSVSEYSSLKCPYVFSLFPFFPELGKFIKNKIISQREFFFTKKLVISTGMPWIFPENIIFDGFQQIHDIFQLKFGK